MNKKTIIAIVAVVLAVAALVGVYFLTRPDTTEGQKAFTVVITHKDGKTNTLALKSDKLYLGECLEEKGIIVGEEGPYGIFIKSVEGEKAVYEEDNAYWAFYVGDDYAALGIDQTPIEDGAVYKLTYTPA